MSGPPVTSLEISWGLPWTSGVVTGGLTSIDIGGVTGSLTSIDESETIALFREMPVIPVNKVVDSLKVKNLNSGVTNVLGFCACFHLCA
jgi:hypothetical protein